MIRLHFEDDNYKVITFPKNFEELKKEVLSFYKINEFESLNVFMLFGKKEHLQCTDEESFKEIIANKDKIFLEFLIGIKSEKLNDVRKSLQMEGRKEYDISLEKEIIYHIDKSYNSYYISVPLLNVGQKKLEAGKGITLYFVNGEASVVANDVVIKEDIDVDCTKEVSVHLYDLYKLKSGEHELQMQLRQGSSKNIGETLHIKFIIQDNNA